MPIFRDKYRKRQLARMDIGRLRECASWGARNTVNSPETDFANRLLARREREAARPCSCCECPACDARIDRWHDGYFAHRNGDPRPSEPDAAEGWDHRRKNLPWVAVDVIERPEGYYHQPLGAFA